MMHRSNLHFLGALLCCFLLLLVGCTGQDAGATPPPAPTAAGTASVPAVENPPAPAATLDIPATRTPSPSATPKKAPTAAPPKPTAAEGIKPTAAPTNVVPPLYGQLHSYTWDDSSKPFRIQLPSMETLSNLDLAAEAHFAADRWDSDDRMHLPGAEGPVRINRDNEANVSTCSIEENGEWREVVRVAIDNISLLAESITGRQQVWVEDCALSPDGQVLAFTVLGGGTQWYDRSVVYTVNVDGSNLSRRTPSVEGVTYWELYWHPYAPILYYFSNDENAGQGFAYHSYNYEEGTRRVMSGSVIPGQYTSSISPDGTVFAFQDYNRGLIVFTEVFDTGDPILVKPKRLPDIPLAGYDRLEWSPDGVHVLGFDGKNATVYRLNFEDERALPVSYEQVTEAMAVTPWENLFWLPWSSNSEPVTACDGSATTYLQVGDYAFANPNAGSVFVVLDEPGGKRISAFTPYQRVYVLSGPACQENWVLWEVYVPALNMRGWTIEMDGGTRRLIPLIPPEGRHELTEIPPTTPATGQPTPTQQSGGSTCPGAPLPRLIVGGKATVSTETDSPNRVRATASRQGEQVGLLPPGTEMTILEGPVCADSYTWWKVMAVVDAVTITGWTVEGDLDSYWLVPVE